GVDEVGQATDEPVMVDADRVPDRAADLPVDRGVLGDDQSDPAPGPGPMVLDDLVVDLAERAGELGEDRCLNKAVAQRHPADPAGPEERAVDGVCGSGGG